MARRAPADVMSHVHESPKVMTVPLALLAVGALPPGSCSNIPSFIEEGFQDFFREAIFIPEGNDILHDCTMCPAGSYGRRS
jgi:NADH-quinone oxidoreductase subunit L